MDSPPDEDVPSRERILESAGGAFGHTVSQLTDLGGTDRTYVLRCQTTVGTVVVKAFKDRPDALVSTCWCMFKLPPSLADEAEQAYRTEVVRAYPKLGNDAVWRHGVFGATIAWDRYNTTLVPEVVAHDLKRHPSLPSPTWRQLLRHRWMTMATSTELPAIAETARRLLTATERWATPPLPGYPAFHNQP